MEDDKKYQEAFELIMNAGNARSAAIMAVEAARNGDFEEAEQCIENAEKDMRLAHQSQTDMIQQEALGNSVEVNIILVHAQDHMAMAIMAIDNAKEFTHLYRQLQMLQKQ